MKKKAIIIMAAIIALVIVVYYSISGPTQNPTESESAATTEAAKPKPLNLSIYLDLSDRIKPDGTDKLSQKDKDIAIIEYLTSHIQERAVKQKILPCQDRVKIFFYPQPADAKTALLSESLELDLGETPMKEKKPKLKTFISEFKNCLEQIYSSTIATGNWVGSDIWGFFNKPIDNYCIKEGYRNVLVVLTDGYIFHVANKQSQGHGHTFILPSTLRDPDSFLIHGREGLDDLEVLMLELNPNPPTDQPKMEQVITDWLKAMGVQKCYVGETDVPSNTKMILDKFLKD